MFTVRIFPEQDPNLVYVGWVKSDFHWNEELFRPDHLASTLITLGDDKGKVRDR